MNRNMIRQAQRQAQKLQDDMQKVQEELESLTVEGSAGGGVVKIVMSGKQTVESVTIEPEAAEEPTPRYLKELQHTIEKENVKVIFSEPQLSISSLSAFISDNGLAVEVYAAEGWSARLASSLSLVAAQTNSSPAREPSSCRNSPRRDRTPLASWRVCA